MNWDMDFLPDHYRIDREQRRSRRWSMALLLVVGCSILMTEGVLRLRLQRLRSTRYHARQQADALALRFTRTEALSQLHQQSLAELGEWVAPLRDTPVTEVLDGILISRPPAMLLQEVDWNGGTPGAGTVRPSLRIAGTVRNLSDIVNFLVAIEQGTDLPALEIRQSGTRGAPTDQSLQAFVVESVRDGEQRR